MKKILAVGGVVLLLGLGGIFGYYWAHTTMSESEAAQFAQDAENMTPIPVAFEVSAPPDSPPDQPLFLSGSEPALGNWDAAGVRLERGDDGKYRGKVEILAGVPYAFKVTRGTWSTVETDAQRKEVPDRPLLCDKPRTIAVTVATWRDGGETIPGRITTSGDIRLHKKFASDVLGNGRTLVVYLPQGYDASGDLRYPVLYMHDGQNLFDESTSYAGVEWRLDEAAQQLIAEGALRPLIIVGIYNTPERDAEFTPPPTGSADKYAKFVIDEVKPFIDKTYRTLPERANTALGGSSMGALPTLYMARHNKDTFGQIAILTPFLRVGDKHLLESWSNDVSWLKGTRLWIDMSPSPRKYYAGDDPVGDARAFVKALESAGLQSGTDYRYVELSEGEHSEAHWQQRADDVLLFLFGTDHESPTTVPTAAAE